MSEERWTIYVCPKCGRAQNWCYACPNHPDEEIFAKATTVIPADSLKPIIEQLRGFNPRWSDADPAVHEAVQTVADALEALTQTGERGSDE